MLILFTLSLVVFSFRLMDRAGLLDLVSGGRREEPFQGAEKNGHDTKEGIRNSREEQRNEAFYGGSGLCPHFIS